MMEVVSGEDTMPNPTDPRETPKKRVNYNYSWPVPARKPKTEQKKGNTSASNDQPGEKARNRIHRAAV